MRTEEIQEAIRHFEYGISHDIFSEPVTSYAKLAVEALKSERDKRPVEEIKEELSRLQIEMDKYSLLALNEKDIKRSTEYYLKANRDATRYWAIRWVIEWEKDPLKEETK